MDCLDDPALLSVLAYFASSLVMIPLNREAAAAHPYTFILACFQCALTVLLLALTPLCCTRARWPRFAFRESNPEARAWFEGNSMDGVVPADPWSLVDRSDRPGYRLDSRPDWAAPAALTASEAEAASLA